MPRISIYRHDSHSTCRSTPPLASPFALTSRSTSRCPFSQAKSELDKITTWMVDISRFLKREINDLDDVRTAMVYLTAIREKESLLDWEFGPVEDKYALLTRSGAMLRIRHFWWSRWPNVFRQLGAGLGTCLGLRQSTSAVPVRWIFRSRPHNSLSQVRCATAQGGDRHRHRPNLLLEEA